MPALYLANQGVLSLYASGHTAGEWPRGSPPLGAHAHTQPIPLAAHSLSPNKKRKEKCIKATYKPFSSLLVELPLTTSHTESLFFPEHLYQGMIGMY